jgi:C1A family cysteine protease
MATVRNIKWYGWIPDTPDHRDHAYKLSRRALRSLPSKVDLRLQMPPVYDQKSLGSCTANAGSGIFQFNQMQQNITWGHMPSRLFLYYNTRIIEGSVNEDSGASIRNTIKAIASSGMCPASKWPYVIKKFAVKPTVKAYAFAADHTAVDYQRLPQELSQLKGCLASGETFIFGFSVYDSFESEEVAKTGIVNLPQSNEQLLGGHAVMAVGYDDTKQRFIVRNSWGDWGMNGYFTMPYSYLTNDNLSDDFWTVKIVK